MMPDIFVAQLKAIAEPTRLRALNLLSMGELSVGELVQCLSQSQPRLSRHMKFLTQAGLVERLPEGSWVFYRLASNNPQRELLDKLLEFVDDNAHSIFAQDRAQFLLAQKQRAEKAESYFSKIAEEWDNIRSLYHQNSEIEAVLCQMASSRRYKNCIDLGTGTGRMLELLSGTADQVEGLDLSHHMLNIARSNLEAANIVNASVRHGNIISTPFDTASADLVLIHQVLHYLESPSRALAEAARILQPGGRLLIADFAPHDLEDLRLNHAHRRLGIGEMKMQTWLDNAGLILVEMQQILPKPNLSSDLALKVNIWCADKPEAV